MLIERINEWRRNRILKRKLKSVVCEIANVRYRISCGGGMPSDFAELKNLNSKYDRIMWQLSGGRHARR